jgi:hypothetical protein
MPDSAKVGTSGSSENRLALLTAMALRRGRRFQYNDGNDRSVNAGVAVVPQPLDLVLHLQFLTLKLHDFQIIDRGMGKALIDFVFVCLMLFFKFRQVRLHRHAICLLKPLLLDDISLAQTHLKIDDTPDAMVRQL